MSWLSLLIALTSLLWLLGCVSQSHSEAKPSLAAAAYPAPSNIELEKGAKAEMLAANCFGCHGLRGRSQAAGIPSLAGLSETYFVNVMQAYQYGGRYSSVMGRIALAYDDAEITRMARYFAAQTPSVPKQRVAWGLVGQGRQLHRRFCQDCHGDLQQQPDPDAVLLHGQWRNYLQWTLQDYLVGINQTKPGMADALSALVRQHGAEGVAALIQYYASGRP
jgi:sulfide dehydrogenase cytochrome subunit